MPDGDRIPLVPKRHAIAIHILSGYWVLIDSVPFRSGSHRNDTMAAKTFVHLTDLHICEADGAEADNSSDTLGTLRKVLEIIKNIPQKPSFIAVSGDLTDRGDIESYRLVRGLIDDLDMPVVYALGNHDTRAGFYRGMLDRSRNLRVTYDHETVIDGIHIIVLDSSRGDRIGGVLDLAQFDFLDAALDREAGLPKLLMVHHPPALDDDADEWASIRLADSRRLGDLIRDRNVIGMLCGHIHQDRVAHWHGVPVIVGNGHHSQLDILHPHHEIRMLEGASIGLCTVRPSGLTVNFIPLPSQRRELAVFPRGDLQEGETEGTEG